jgi:hypothetical protein
VWAWVSNASFADGGESGSLSAAKPKRSFDGSFGADDLSGNPALGAELLNKLPFIAGVVFFALWCDSEVSNTSPGDVFEGDVGECMSTSGLSSTVGGSAFFCFFREGMSLPVDSSLPPCSSVAL